MKTTNHLTPFLSIVILNWNSIRDTLPLLSSIEKQKYPGKMEIWVVDNGSTDGSVEKIKKSFPNTKIIALSKNVGIWARNFAFKKTRGDVIVTLDSDAYLTSNNTLTKLVSKLIENPGAGIIGCKIISKRPGKFSPMHLNFYTGAISVGNPGLETGKVTWVSFICSAFTRKTLKKVGLTYKAFAYGEDLNFCLRIKKAGLKVLYWPETEVLHYKRKGTSDVPFSEKYYHYYKSIFRNIYGYGNIFQKISVTVFQLCIIPAFLFFSGQFKRVQVKERYWGFWWNIKRVSGETKIFWVVFLLGLTLRLLAFNQRAFWFDEAFTYHLARLPLNQLFSAVLSDNNPPLYYLLIHFVLKLGSDQILLRIPSLIFNMATMQIIYFQFRNKIGKSTSLIAAVLFAVSPLTIYMATEARLHSLGVFEAIFLTSLFFSLLKNRQLKNYIFFTLFGIVCAYTQYYLILLMLPFSWLALKEGLNKKIWAGILVTIVISLLPWLYLSALVNHNGCACPTSLLSLPASLVSPVIGGVGPVTLRAFPNLPFALIILFSFTTFLTFIFFLKGLGKSFLTSSFLIPLAILTILGSLYPVFSPKAFGVFNPLFFLILAQGINRKAVAIMIFALFLCVSIIQLINPFFKGDRMQDVANIVSEDSLPIAHTSTYTYYSINYYTQTQNILLTKNPLSPVTVFYIGGQKSELPHQDAWLIDTKTWADPEERNEVLKQVNQNFIIEKAFMVGNIAVEYLKPR